MFSYPDTHRYRIGPNYWTCVDAPLGERVAAGLGRARRAAA
jgi:catalase